ncbi:MAG TPA: zinc metalloprotease HtpX [Ktedonobacterales bacterium]|jgi:heat shock protein HtpX|nr:zinc metalloprotease HtpX [Ktedonobacterales bacterium]
MVHQGRPRWYKPDVGLSMRMLLTMFILGAVYIVFGAVLFRYGYGLLFVPLALIIGVAQFFFADKIALASMGAREVDESEAPELHEMIGRLAMQADLPKPKIALVNSSIPNAFATGRDKNHAVVAVTTGIYNKLNPQELEAVLAHELTHIINRDMLVMTIATFFSMIASLIVQNIFWISIFGGGYGGGYGGRRRNDENGAFAITVLASVIVYAISFFLIRTLSRYRELAADRGSALITGQPQNLASALLRISETITSGGIPQQDFRRAQGVNALFIVPALRGDSLASLFSTHPSTEERVERLMAMQRQMESAGYIS